MRTESSFCQTWRRALTHCSQASSKCPPSLPLVTTTMMMERVSRMWNTLMIVIMELKKGLTHQHSSSRGQPLLRPQATKRMMGRPRSKVVKRPVNFVNMFFSCATVSLLLYQHLYLFITNLKCTKYSILSNDIENVLIFCHFSKLCI